VIVLAKATCAQKSEASTQPPINAALAARMRWNVLAIQKP